MLSVIHKLKGTDKLQNAVEIVYNEHEDQAEFARYNRFSL